MSPFERLYLILRPTLNSAEGHARLERQGCRARIHLFVHGFESPCRLRCLLLSQPEPEEAVIDLGIVDISDKGQGILEKQGILLPENATLSCFRSLILCEDWPKNRLVMTAAIDQRAHSSQWALQGAVSHYLRVPVKASSAPEAPSPAPPPEPAPAPLPPSAPPLPLDELAPLVWPEPLEELKTYFDLLPPCAPLDAPGWRFVRVPLPQGGPGPFCHVGILPRDGRILMTAYALPASDHAAPPPGAEGFIYETGRLKEGYWVLRQGIDKPEKAHTIESKTHPPVGERSLS